MTRELSRDELEERFDCVGDIFVGGLVRVREGGRCFHVRPDGTRAYENYFDDIVELSEDRPALAKKDGSDWFPINRDDGTRVS